MDLLMGIFKFAVAIFAVILIIVGIPTFVSPIPFGFVFIALGFALLVLVAPDFVRWLRKRSRFLDRQLHKLEKVLPEWIAGPLRSSDYYHGPDDEDEQDEEREDGDDETSDDGRALQPRFRDSSRPNPLRLPRNGGQL